MAPVEVPTDEAITADDSRQFGSQSAEDVRAEVWVRKKGRTRSAAAWAVGVALVWLLLPLAGFAASHGYSVGGWIGLVAFCWGVAVVALLSARRFARTGVWLASDGVVIRNPARTVVVPLGDAEEFVPGVAGSGNGTPCPVLKRRQGQQVGIWALGREGFIWSFKRYSKEMQPLCDELNSVLQTLHQHS